MMGKLGEKFTERTIWLQVGETQPWLPQAQMKMPTEGGWLQSSKGVSEGHVSSWRLCFFLRRGWASWRQGDLFSVLILTAVQHECLSLRPPATFQDLTSWV